MNTFPMQWPEEVVQIPYGLSVKRQQASIGGKLGKLSTLLLMVDAFAGTVLNQIENATTTTKLGNSVPNDLYNL